MCTTFTAETRLRQALGFPAASLEMVQVRAALNCPGAVFLGAGGGRGVRKGVGFDESVIVAKDHAHAR